MASAPPDPAIAAWDDGGNNGLDAILARAFGILGGYLELNTIFEAIRLNLFEEIGAYDLPMRTVIYKVRETITSEGMQRQTLEALFVKLPGNSELRTWTGQHVPDLLPLVPQATFETVRPAYEADRMQRRVQSIERNFEKFGTALTLDAADKQVARDIIQRLQELDGFKGAHDALHQLQMTALAELQRVAAGTTPPAIRAMSILLQLENLRTAGDAIRARMSFAGISPAAAQARNVLIDQIEKIISLIGRLDRENPKSAETAASVLRSLLRQQMAQFDSLLVTTSEQIPFGAFASAIARLPQPATIPVNKDLKEDPVLIANIQSGFQDVANRLVMRQSVHRYWQQIDATIFNVEELLAGSGREIEIEFHWQNIQSLIGDIARFPVEPDVTSVLSQSGIDVAAQIDPAQVRDESFRLAFSMFTSFARVRFQRADTALLEDCGLLRQLNDPLKALLS
ncbi:hypothetical protein [Novosphingobium sp. AAP93]|uniref:hypothetical protein n=1 Tax=Novosphingobium sp. AAP93 TaxID=1523427 RepID=UPI0006B9CD09|nr:hypothetical protein [Novosphingobium sp. AAP93]KPF80845.1 hypothetical protein IP83_14085 [Novosphingobium sp. AAP93]